MKTLILIFALSLLILSACVEKPAQFVETDLSKFESVHFFWDDTLTFKIEVAQIVSASRRMQGNTWYWICEDKAGKEHIFILNNMRRIVIEGSW